MFTPRNLARHIANVVVCALFCSLIPATALASGAVYAMTNALDNNQIRVYSRAADGSLNLIQTAATGGGGSGLQLAGVDSLGSAGSLQLDASHKFLFVVNTESAAPNNGAGAYNTDCQQGTITSFAVASDGSLTFADRVFSGGLFPNSVAVTTIQLPTTGDNGNGKDNGNHNGDKNDVAQARELVYVLNAGGPEVPICNLTPGTANTPNITGFQVDAAGHLIPLNTTQSVDPGPATGPAGGVSCTAATEAGYSGLTGAPAADFQCGLNPPSFAQSPSKIAFTPDSSRLVVTVKGTNSIYVFPVDNMGIAGTATISQAPGPALPAFTGFAFSHQGALIVAEFFGSATSIPSGGAGAVSSFTIGGAGTLTGISSHVGDGGTAASAIAVEPISGKYAYVANLLSASISSYTVGANSSLTLLSGTAASGTGPNDLVTAVEGTSSFLYVLNAGTGTIGAFRINSDGSLTAVTGGSGLPTNSAQGLAAF